MHELCHARKVKGNCCSDFVAHPCTSRFHAPPVSFAVLYIGYHASLFHPHTPCSQLHILLHHFNMVISKEVSPLKMISLLEAVMKPPSCKSVLILCSHGLRKAEKVCCYCM